MVSREVALCLVVCMTSQLDHWAQPRSAPGGDRFLTPISVSSPDIYYPRKSFYIMPNGFSVCSFLTMERPPMKTKYDCKKGHSSSRENLIPAQPSFLEAAS